jgi:pimeloyl-ACP methyl ester carboxylesterase
VLRRRARVGLPLDQAARAAGLPVKSGRATVDGVAIHYRDIGHGDEVLVLLHGFPETGDAFAPAVAALGARYRLIVPDLRGSGGSDRPASGYDKKTMATDVKALLDQLKIRRVHLFGHDIGARVAYAFALQYPELLSSLTVGEGFIEGLAGTAQMKQLGPSNPRTRHFALFAKFDEATAQYRGEEQELVLGFMNSRSKRPFSAADVALYTASLQRDGGLAAAFRPYEAFDRDAAFVEKADVAKIAALPTLAIGCQGPSASVLYRQLTAAGLKGVKSAVLDGCEHWLFEENPAETVRALLDFLDASSPKSR